MSWTTIAETTQAAKKEHRCSWCGEQIVIGESYLRSRVVFEGEPQTNKLHIECADAAADDYREWGEGYMPYENQRPPKPSPRAADPNGASEQ